MTWLRRARPALFVLGGLLVIGSLLGARLLAGSDPPKTTNPTNGKNGSGPVFIGFVDSDPPPVAYGLPSFMQSGQIAEVFKDIKEGVHVEKDTPLFKFDSSTWEQKLATAEQAVGVARADVTGAQAKVTEHQLQIDAQQVAVDAAKRKAHMAERTLDVGKFQLRESYRLGGTPKEEWETRLKGDIKILELEGNYEYAAMAQKAEEAKLDALRKTDPNVLIEKAKAGVKYAEAVRDEAKKAVEMCTVKAKTAGTIEQINVSAGTALGISTRTPALWLIPDGPKVVRAEIEPDFAHRVSLDMIGRQVIIYDHTDPRLTYKGTLKRISGSFLAKRAAGENLLGNDTKVLEAVVEVTDPAPPGQPPLRVGQKVKVNFGQ
ncbi:MAG TPA: hypothetical protein VKE74_29470 [Gemmataceae bacterium]|nr:hypothetical protein [Gemmataceae bacterium]